MATTHLEYHENENNHGNYQFVTLKTIVDSFMLRMQDDDHILKNTRRYLIVSYAKEVIKKLNLELKNDVRYMEITVPDSLYFALPHDYVDYARVSVVVKDKTTDSFRLQPLDINSNINIADGYLQDNNAEILFDIDGNILLADSANAYNKPYKKYNFTPGCSSPTADTSKYSKHGEFKIDKRPGKNGGGKIVFSSELADNEIVLEYISDGLSPEIYNDSEIKISKYLEQTAKDWIFFAGIEYKRNVSQSEKNRAFLRYKTSLHKAKLDLSGFDLLSISKSIRISTQNK